jgi:hypothetical protein
MPSAAVSAAARPFALADFQHARRGETVIVCGCGESLNLLTYPERFITIGVNDVGRKFDPTYLVVLNPRQQFAGDRFRYVEQSRAQYLFTQLDLKVPHPAIVKFRLGRYGGTAFDDPHVLHFTRNSPYVALCLAVHLGATHVGLIGVDFTDHHFFAATGTHPLSRRLDAIDAEYQRLRHALDGLGVRVTNLSPQSRLTAFDKGTIADLASDRPALPAPAPAASLNVVSYATTPVAGVPAILARCIANQTTHRSRCVWATRSYGNGVSFDGDVEWQTSPAVAESALRDADVVVVHNGKIDPRHERAIAGKPIVTLAHNYIWNVDRRFERQGFPALVVGQYQATLPEFAGWTSVPNPVPTWEPAYMPGRKSDVVTICYTPSGRHERYPLGHRLYWHGKGYDTTMRVLERLARSTPIRLEVIGQRQVSHADALAMKRRAHIVIDECVTGSFHRNSLEGLSAGCLVINGVGLLPGVAEALQRSAPEADRVPFVFSTLELLETVLRELIERGPRSLAAEGQRSRAWMERHWNFRDQWTRVWAPAIDAARRHPIARTTLGVARTGPQFPQEVVVIPAAAPVAVTAPADRVSVVVPHGGAARLPQLVATLITLRQQSGVGEIIVAEMGDRPVAAAVAERWADKHLFVEHRGAFERARVLNAGAAVADHQAVLWMDNDLIAPREFVAHSLKELRDRRLDFLVPYSSVRYLSESDSQAVMRGERNPADCQPVNTFYSGRRTAVCFGGIGLVRRDFVQRHGGLIEGFRGWGGEDNAWNRKVSLLGRSAPTTRPDRHVYHLYHPSSGGYLMAAASATNPHYAENVALLRRVWAVRDRTRFVQEFPATPPAAGVLTASNGRVHATPRERLPIWTYWEGACPPWIRACRRTIAAYAPAVRFLTPELFDRMRDHDRDIDLSRLHAPHRADYIRAFLLQRYGGLWIDADCVVMQPLQPILDLLAEHDFVGHRERVGLISNAFIAARPGSRIAAEFYDRICQILRGRKPLYWNALGADPLSAVVAANDRGWYELPCERVQPVCWSAPGDFFAERDDEAHAGVFDARAICYMMSNGAINNYTTGHRAADLMAERTFFRYLLRRAVGTSLMDPSAPYEEIFSANVELYRRQRLESLSGPGSSLSQTAELRERLPLLLEELGVRSLLDAPCGDFNWMQHVRLGVEEYIGVDVLGELIAQNQWHHAGPHRRFARADVLRDPLPRADAVLCRDLLNHLSYADIRQAIRNFKGSGATYLMATTFTRPRPNQDTAGGEWRPLNFAGDPFDFPPPLRLLNEKCTEAGETFNDKSIGVWRLSDVSV